MIYLRLLCHLHSTRRRQSHYWHKHPEEIFLPLNGLFCSSVVNGDGSMVVVKWMTYIECHFCIVIRNRLAKKTLRKTYPRKEGSYNFYTNRNNKISSRMSLPLFGSPNQFKLCPLWIVSSDCVPFRGGPSSIQFFIEFIYSRPFK